VEGAQYLDLGYGVEGAAFIGEEIDARERFEAATEARFGAPDSFGDGRDEAGIPGVEVQDTIGLAVADRAEDYSLTPVDRHPRPPA
jgi:hypothetical protein